MVALPRELDGLFRDLWDASNSSNSDRARLIPAMFSIMYGKFQIKSNRHVHQSSKVSISAISLTPEQLLFLPLPLKIHQTLLPTLKLIYHLIPLPTPP
jgi:hypothetical protein